MSEYIVDTTEGILDARTTGELVRCKDCALYDREDGICYRDPNHSGYYRPAHDDGFCAWAEKREDEHMDLRELDAIADAMDGGDE